MNPFMLFAAQAGKRLYQAQPLAYLQIPANGVIVRTLVSLPGVCPTWDSSEMINDTYQFLQEKAPTICPMINKLTGCVEGAGDDIGSSNFADAPYRFQFETFAKGGHGVVMIRKPESRIAASYFQAGESHVVKSLEGIMQEVNQTANSSQMEMPAWPEYNVSLKEHIAAMPPGYQVKMLTRGYNHCSDDASLEGQHHYEIFSPTPTSSDVELAKQKLRTEFPFVGIADEWELSMCLLHTTFGGACSPEDVLSKPLKALDSILSELHEGESDPYDTALYLEAKAIFKEQLTKFNLNDKTCQPCYDQMRGLA